MDSMKPSSQDNRRASNGATRLSTLFSCMILGLMVANASAFTQNHVIVQGGRKVSPSRWFAPSLLKSTVDPNPPQLSMEASPELETSGTNGEGEIYPSTGMPQLGSDGLYHVMNREQHKALLEANQDKLVVFKIFAPWCRACKGLEPKFKAIAKDTKYEKVPIIWADLTIQHNKDFVKSLGVLALPSVQFYVHGGLVENFPCGPSKVNILKKKLAQFINTNVDASTFTVKPEMATAETAFAPTRNETGLYGAGAAAYSSPVPKAIEPVPATREPDTVVDTGMLTPEQKAWIRAIPYLAPLSDDEFETLLSKGKVLTFEAGSIIMREGGPGRTFYFITQGEVEVCQRTSFEDPLTTPASYLGSVVNTLEAGEFFGERSLITGEPRAASIRASSDDAVKTIAFDMNDFPDSCVLSGKISEAAIQEAAYLDDKYGLSLTETYAMDKQIVDIRVANQVRGSVNTPNEIDGVDNDKEPAPFEKESLDLQQQVPPQQATPMDGGWKLVADTESLVPLLVRFKLLRMVGRCFDYIVANSPRLDELGARRRRSMLLGLLPPSTRSDFKDAFELIDTDGDKQITLMELRRSLESVGAEKTEDELKQLIRRSVLGGMAGSMDGKEVITEENFYGLMAEADFYNLFLDTFKALDVYDSGFVKASELDRVLCGVRDLISDDRKSIIDIEDRDVLIDYEQFSKMLLGRTLQ